MSTTGGRLPYPGLRSFTREETDLFFGREGCVDDMVDRLAATRFLAVLGASGSGKSSLVKTGLLDALEIGLLHEAGSRWLIADFRPGEQPIEAMAEGLIKAASSDPGVQTDEEEVKLLRTFLARGPRSVIEWCEANVPEGANLLLLVDQFEELFRYGAYTKREEAEAFVATLLESAAAPLSQARIYVAITMRSEYLGAAALIDGLAEAINKGLYLTPRMSRDQVREAIVGPAAVCGFSIEPALVNRLLNDLTSFAPWEHDDNPGHQLELLVRRSDQLPLMQHVLNRLWSIAAEHGGDNHIVLKLSDYEAIGGLRGALAAHGREILEELLPEHRAIASTVFRALTSGSSLAEAVRRPIEFSELVEIAGGDEIAVREIIEAFRAPGRNFLVPPRPVPLRPTTVIDISHESLIRQWDEFAAWLQQEVTAADTWRRLVDAAERYGRGEANLLSDLALASNASWWDREQPTAAWAKRYGGDFEQTAKFLAESRSAAAASEEAKAQEQRQKSRNRLVTVAAIAIVCVFTPLTVFAGYFAWRANQETIRANQQTAFAVQEAHRANEAAAFADLQRSRANQLLNDAEIARQNAEIQKKAAEDAVVREQEAARQAAAAQQQVLELERQQREAEEKQKEQARRDFQQANLEQLATRVSNLQQARSWEAASNLLGTFWNGLVGQNAELQKSWLIDPIAKAFGRQKLAEYPVFPEFLAYSGFTGWTGTYGRFRVYSLDHKASDGSAASGNKTIGLFDALTGAAVGNFELPAGAELGSELDLVTPDGKRVAIVTTDPTPDDGKDDRQVALWVSDLSAPTLIPMPLGEKAKVDQIAPVSSDDRFGLYFTDDSNPAEIAIVDPATGTTTFSATTDDIAHAVNLDKIEKVALLGLVGDQLLMLVNDKTDGQLLSIDIAQSTAREVETGGGITGAELTPDGALLLTLTCPSDCAAQSLTAYDMSAESPLWVESVPTGMTFTDTEVEETSVDGKPAYSALVQNKGIGIAFQIPTDQSAPVVRLAADTNPRVGIDAFDGEGGFKTMEPASDVTSSEGVDAAGLLTDYRVPIARQKLRLYVAPNSIAVYQGKDAIRIAGVTYDGSLLVYRMRPDGAFEEDVSFRPMTIAGSNCISAVAFSGDGRSLLFRHYDESLLYVAAVGNGPSVGWHRGASGRAGESLIDLAESTPETTCDAPDTTATDVIPEKIVAVDKSPGAFALLDKKGVVWWVNVTDAAGDTTREGQRGAGASGTSIATSVATATATREFGPLERAAEGRIWIAGDPDRSRLALVSRSAVDIVPKPPAAVGDSAGPADTAGGQPVAAVAPDLARRQKLLGGSEPQAAVFTPQGDVIVAYNDGQITGFRQTGDGAWANLFSGTAFLSAQIVGLFATRDKVAVVDDRDVIDAFDVESGALVGAARLPANPSVLALKPDGKMLSVEWDTDSVATVEFGALTAGNTVETARLVTMRSPLDPEADANLDALAIDQEMERSLTTGASGAATCVDTEARQLSALETRLLGDTAPAEKPAASTPNCDSAGNGAFDAAETLAQRGQSASVREMVEDGTFSRVLQAAVAGDSTATRVLGAVLAKLTIERGDVDRAEVAADAIRFGTSVPAVVMKEIAGGGPIAPALLDAARRRSSAADPAIHQLLAHWHERQLNDLDSLTEALFEYAVAERLYRESDRASEAEFVARRRAQLARLLPDSRVLAALQRVDAWKPEVAPASASPTLPSLPTEPTARRTFDMDNADKLAERLSDSPMLAALRTELERARIFDLRAKDPKAAAELMIALGRRTSGSGTWSPDTAREYLALADEIGVRTDAVNVFRLAAEAMKLIGESFTTPIQANADAVELFRRAATLIASSATSAPPDVVQSEMKDVDLSLLTYEYETLPAIGAAAEVSGAEAVLEAAAEMGQAVAGKTDEPDRWNWLAGESLFWQGVLVNDVDAAKAVPILQKAAAIMRPIAEASPDDVTTRFRYAEAVRWVGLAEPSTEDTAATEREAVKQYEALWDKRLAIDSGLLTRIGAGYGFALANLAQTTREYELADLADGRTATDHTGWVLEVLALAAEKDELNTSMIDIGAATGDSGFVAGWYQMSSYGWPIGFLSGMVNLERGVSGVTKCDLLAADPYDPLKRAPGLTLDKVDTAAAETECRAEHARQPDDARTTYQLARVISADTKREAEYLPIAREAAAKGASPAFSLVAYALSQKNDTRSSDAYVATTQHTLIESFPVLYPFLAVQAKTQRERTGLAFYAGKAAELGVPEAQLALADLGDDPAERLFHAKLAVRLFTEKGNAQAAGEAARKAALIDISPSDAGDVDSKVAAWTPQALVDLPADAGAS
jgi:Novel STAND NTPase 1